jgi:hypothetical protein
MAMIVRLSSVGSAEDRSVDGEGVNDHDDADRHGRRDAEGTDLHRRDPASRRPARTRDQGVGRLLETFVV